MSLKCTEKQEKKWYEKYKKLPSVDFVYENSGKMELEAPPYHARHNDSQNVIDIEGLYGMNKVYKVLGYTENPPFPVNYPAVAIMFEDLQFFRRVWWHYEA